MEHHSHDRLNEAQKVCAPASQLRKRQEMGKGGEGYRWRKVKRVLESRKGFGREWDGSQYKEK